MTFTCSDCGDTFEAGRPDEEAQQEALENFGRRGDAPGMAIVCDDCYKEIMAVIEAERRYVRTLPVIAISMTDVDLQNVDVSELERELARRILAVLERDLMQQLMTGLAADERPTIGISPTRTARGILTDGN